MSEQTTVQVEGGQFVSFCLGNEEYGIPIMRVQEIIRYEQLTAVPQSSEFVKGVLNLRGKVIPVIDLRSKFNLPTLEADRHTRIVVVEVSGRTIGMVVDEVREVINIATDSIDPAPPLGSRIGTDYIAGMGKIADSLVILLNIDQLLTEDEHTLIGGV